MVESTIVYGFLTIIMVLCGCLASRRQFYFERKCQIVGRGQKRLSFAYWEIWLPIILFAVIFGCRYDVGIDYMQYREWYFIGFNKEFLWGAVIDVFSNCGFHYAFYFTFWAFIQIILIYYAIKDYRFLFAYIAFYLIVGKYFLSMMNTMRFSTVACMFFYSAKYIINKQFFKYLLCILIASLIHKTAIVLIVFYPLFRYKQFWFNIKLQIIILSASLILMFNREFALYLVLKVFNIFIDFFDYQAGYHYINNTHFGVNVFNQSAQFGRGTGLGEYVFLFLGLMIMYYQKELRRKYKSSLFNITYTLWFIAFSCGFIAGKSYVLGRPLLYLANFKMLMFAFFTHYCFSSKKLEDKLMGTIFIMIHIALFINIISMGEANKAAFTFFWQH